MEETNLYAAQTNRKGWTTLTCEELRAYIGVLLLTSVNRMHHLQMYWCSDSLFHVNETAQVMTYKRFLLITNCLHLNDNAHMLDYGTKDFDLIQSSAKDTDDEPAVSGPVLTIQSPRSR